MDRHTALHRAVALASGIIGIFVFVTGIASLSELLGKGDDKSLRDDLASVAEAPAAPPSTTSPPPSRSDPRTLVSRRVALTFGMDGSGGLEGFSLITGRKAPRGAADLVVDHFGSQFIPDNADVYPAGPIVFESVFRCPVHKVPNVFEEVLMFRRSNYSGYVPIATGHVYCVSLGRGRQYAKLVVDEVIGSRRELTLVARYTLQRNGSPLVR